MNNYTARRKEEVNLDTQIRHLIRYLESISWSSHKTAPAFNPDDIDARFRPVFDTIDALKTDFENILAESEKAWDAIETQNTFNKLRAEIWKIASEKDIDQNTLVQSLLNKVGPEIKVSRACYNEFIDTNSDHSDLVCVTEWCDDDVSPSLGTRIPAFLVNLFKTKDVFHFTVDSAAAMVPKLFRPTARAMIKSLTIPLNLQSWAILPFIVNEQVIGWFTFDICRDNPHNPEMSDTIKEIIGEMVEIVRRNLEYRQASDALKRAHDQLESRVEERTAQLAESNRKLIREIEVRKHTEAILQESEKKYRTLFNTIADPVYIFEKESLRFLACNAAFLRVYGYTEEDLELMLPYDFHPLEELELVRSRIHTRNRDNPNQYTHITRSGEHLSVEIITDETVYQGKSAWVSIIRDITARKQAEDRIRESYQSLQTMIEAVPFAIMIVDRKKRIQQVNEAALRLIECERDALIARTCHETFYPEGRVCPVLDKAETLDHRETMLINSSGKAIPVLKSVTPVTIRGEELLLETCIDITEIHEAKKSMLQARKAAEQANRLKTRFLANVSHEIRTPLNAIIGFADIIRNSTDPERMRAHADIMMKESETLLFLINSLLDHARIEAGKLDIEPRIFAVRRLIDQIQAICEPECRKKDLDFSVDITDRVPEYIRADEIRLKQILVNLTGNSIKFTEEGGITLRVDTDGDDGNGLLHFSVSDTGIGIPVEEQTLIFESFTQGDSDTTRKYGGAGLGVTIAKELVELMGGVIDVESAPGEGSTFRFTIPLPDGGGAAESRHTALQSEEDAAPSLGFTGTVRILIAEDYPANQEILRQYFLESDCLLTFAGTGSEAVAAAAEEQFDYVLLDIQMPEMDGYETARRLRSLNDHYRQVPIIGLTAYADGESREGCIASGMDDVLVKPVRKRVLFSLLNRIAAETPSGSIAGQQAMSQKEAGKEEPPLDMAVCLEEFGSRENVRDVVSRFLQTLSQQLPHMATAVHSDDFDRLAREAHAIKGGAAALEARAVREAAHCLERAAKAASASCGELLRSLESAVGDLVSFSARILSDQSEADAP